MSQQEPRRGKGRDLTTGNVFKHLLFFSFPLLIGNVLQSANQLIDAFWVGRFIGPHALAAIAVSGPVVFVLLAFVFGFVIATSTMVAQYKGANDDVSLQKTIDSSTKALTITALILTVVAIVMTPYLLKFLQTPPDIFDMAHQYLVTFFSGLLFIGGFNFLSAILRGLGDSKTPLYFLIVSVVVNIVLDPFLIIGIGPFPEMGVLGASLATVFSHALSFVLGLLYIKRKDLGFKIRLFQTKMEKFYLSKMIKMGIPAGMQQVIVSTAVVVVMGAVNLQGATVVAGFGTATRLDAFIFLPTMTLGLAISAMVGQNIGAQKWERIPEIVRSGFMLALIITGTLSVLLFFFREQALAVFTDDPSVIREGASYLKIVVFALVPFSFMFILTGVLRGAGDMLWGLILTAISLWGLRVPLVYALAYFLGANGIWYGIAISMVLAFGVVGVYYLTGNWKKKSLVKETVRDDKNYVNESGEPAKA